MWNHCFEFHLIKMWHKNPFATTDKSQGCLFVICIEKIPNDHQEWCGVSTWNVNKSISTALTPSSLHKMLLYLRVPLVDSYSIKLPESTQISRLKRLPREDGKYISTDPQWVWRFWVQVYLHRLNCIILIQLVESR